MPTATDVITPPEPSFGDANGDGGISITDAGGWLLHAFFLPGDWSLWALATYAPSVARFLEVDAADYGGLASGMISAAAWILGVIAVGMTWAYVRDLDRRATRGFVGLLAHVMLRSRIMAATFRARRRDSALRQQGALDFSTAVELEPLEFRALRLHAELAPGYSLSARDVASALRRSVGDARKLLDSLKDRSLLNRTLGGPDDESAYTLSDAGRASLLLKQIGPRA
jgi:hypothetical protein